MKDKLNELLRNWAAQRTPDDRRIQDLAGRISSAVSAAGQIAPEELPRPNGYRILAGRIPYVLVGAAAGILIAVLVGLPGGGRKFRPVADNTIQIASISKQELTADNQLFQHMEALFHGNLRWVAQTDGQVQLGIHPEQESFDRTAIPMVIRTVIVYRKKGERSWQTTADVRVVARSEEMVTVALNPKSGDRLTLWAYPVSTSAIAVDSSLSLQTPIGIASSFSIVATPGKPTGLLSVTTVDGEYRVLQTVESLRGPRGGSC